MTYIRRRGVGEVRLVLEEVIELSNHHGVGEACHVEVHRWPCDDDKIGVKKRMKTSGVVERKAWP